MADAQNNDVTSRTPSPGEEVIGVYTNYFYANVQADMTRLVFAEHDPHSKNVHYRAAVVMTTENAKLLIELLTRLIATETERKSET